MSEPDRRIVSGGVAAALIALGVACGGGGGGGGSNANLSNPAAPPPPTGPTPSGEQAGSQTLFGEVEGMFDPTASFAGATIRVTGIANDTIATDNTFFLDPVPAGRHVLAVSGANLLNRKVEIEMKSGGANEIASLGLVEEAPFNLRAFDEIYREEGETGTARFTERPDFFIDDRSFGELSGGNGNRLRSEVQMAITGPIRRAVGPLFSGLRVSSRTLKQEWESPCDLPEGHVYWYAHRDLRDEEGSRLLGQAWWCWWSTQHRVRGGILRLDAEANPGVIHHELVHLLGTADHLEKAPGSSVIRVPSTASGLTAMDERHLEFLYARPPGLMTPDDATGLGLNDLTTRASSSGAEVRCRIYPDGRVVLDRGPLRGFGRWD